MAIDFYPRLAMPLLVELSRELRIVMVGGPRQAGKSTLLRQYLGDHGGTYRTLDDEQTRLAVRDDPVTFVSAPATPLVVDEVQLGGEELVRSIKVAVDQDPRPGRFLLSGSSRFLTVPTLSESLAGRVAFLELWPLTMAERTGSADSVQTDASFLDRAFSSPSEFGDSTWSRQEYINAIVDGGYPEVSRIGSDLARRAWHEGYLSTVINRDIRDFASIEHGDAVRRLLGLIAARAGGLTNLADLARGVGLARDTTRNYLRYLDMVYLTVALPAWSTNLNSRLVKTPKLYPSDSGVAAHLLGVGADDLAEPGNAQLGSLTETFVVNELTRLIAGTGSRSSLFHVRSVDQHEVDLIIQDRAGRIVALEVKATASPGSGALKGLRWLRDRLGDQLHAGILLHMGDQASAHGDRIFTAPLSALWGHRRADP